MSEIENLIINSSTESGDSESVATESVTTKSRKKSSKKKVAVDDTTLSESNALEISEPKTPKRTRAKKTKSSETEALVDANDPAKDPANEEKALSAKTLSELKDQCKALGIKGYSKKNKNDLIELITNK